ncbi:MAG TPA: hypothetical protein VJX92_23855 [Methylomirabilota bacterium]|nr:hypothetical protein [Methylomirabilota bacterium]
MEPRRSRAAPQDQLQSDAVQDQASGSGRPAGAGLG